MTGRAGVRPLGYGWRWWRLGLHLLWGGCIVAWRYPRQSLAQQQVLRQRWCQQLLRCLGVRLEVSGAWPRALAAQESEQASGQLLVANHLSWLDVVVFNACVATDFVAKEELRHWFFLGWLAKKNGTLFLPRHSPRQVQMLNTQLAQRLQAGGSVLVFPEGTTSADGRVLPFYPALFQAALDAHVGVQPLALAYCDAAGAHSSAPVYAGDCSLWQSLRRVMAAPDLVARVQLCPVLATQRDSGPAAQQRRQLAQHARAAIAARLPASAMPPRPNLSPPSPLSPLLYGAEYETPGQLAEVLT